MMEPEEPGLLDLSTDPGLCTRCRFLEIVRSRRSAFLYCGRSRVDQDFVRYPPLPVLQCRGFESRKAAKEDQESTQS